MDDVFVVAIVAIVFVAFPAIVLKYVMDWRKTRSFSTDDERLVDDLWKTAQRLERRVDALEKILDKEAPTWREDYKEQSHA
jgi:phage shock protein B